MKSIKEFINKNINESRLLSNSTSKFNTNIIENILNPLIGTSFKFIGNIEELNISGMNILSERNIKDPKIIGLFVEWIIRFYLANKRNNIQILPNNNIDLVNNGEIYSFCDFKYKDQDFEIKTTSRDYNENAKLDNNNTYIKFNKGISITDNQRKSLKDTIIIIVSYTQDNDKIKINNIWVRPPNKVLINMTTIDGILK